MWIFPFFPLRTCGRKTIIHTVFLIEMIINVFTRVLLLLSYTHFRSESNPKRMPDHYARLIIRHAAGALQKTKHGKEKTTLFAVLSLL